MAQLRLLPAFKLRDNTLGQYLPEFHSPLIKGIDIPDGGLGKDIVLVEGYELTKCFGYEPLSKNCVRSNEISRAYAKGSVKIVKQDRTATAKEAFFDNTKGEITLKGDVVVFQGQDKVTGNVVTYYINEDKVVVEGEPEKKARAVLTPRSKTSEK